MLTTERCARSRAVRRRPPEPKSSVDDSINDHVPPELPLKLSIVGSGYVGLITGVCLAERGHDVTLVDIDSTKVDAINAGRSPIHEEGLAPLLEKHAGRSVRATRDLDAAVQATDLTMIAAPTPFDGLAIDLSAIRTIAHGIGESLAKKTSYHVVVVKSTVVPGTTDGTVTPILERASGKHAGEHFGVGMNPEFLSEGVALSDFLSPDRIVLGGMDERTTDAMARLYESFTDAPVLRTNNRTAEMIKYASNALQATMISFANEIGNLCEGLGGMDVVDVLHGTHLMKELTFASPGSAGRRKAGITGFLGAGCGFGGSCFPKDVKAIVAHGQAHGITMSLLQSVLEINQAQPVRMVEMLEQAIGSLAGRRIAVLGLAFKPGTDDMRESPSLPIIRELVQRGANVQAYDPIANDAARRALPGVKVEFCSSLDAALRHADAIALVTKWAEFTVLPEKIRALEPVPTLVDGRRFVAPESVPRYFGIGLGREG